MKYINKIGFVSLISVIDTQNQQGRTRVFRYWQGYTGRVSRRNSDHQQTAGTETQ